MFVRRMLLRAIALAVVVVPLFLGNVACRPTLAPVYQVSGARLTPYTGVALTDAEVRDVIVRGATAKRWTVASEEPGALFAEISHDGHYAKVRIPYNAAGYAIEYVESSPSLKYDGANIHRRYNHWVRLLNDSIQREFSQYQAAKLAQGAPSTPVTVTSPAAAEPPLPAAPEATPAQPAPTPDQPAPTIPTPAPGAAPPAPTPAPPPAPVR